MKKSIRIGDGIAEFFGTHDGNIKYLESLLKVQVHIDGENNLTIDGEDTNVQLVERLVQDYSQLRAEGVKFANGDLKSIIRIISEDTTQSLRGVVSTSKTLQIGKRNVSPKTLNQKLYLEAIERYDMVFGIGPAGTGKTYLAVSMAVRALLEKKVNRIVLTLPYVIAGVDGIASVPFTERHVLRRPLVQRIVRAYEACTTQSILRQQWLQFGQTTNGEA